MNKSILQIVAASILFLGITAHAAPAAPKNGADPIAREVLANPLRRVDQGATPGVDAAYVIHRNFPQIIEQNFARLNAAKMSQLIDVLSDAELSDLAQLYANATTDNGLPQRLLYLMAGRLDVRHLGRLSMHFGFAPMYAEVPIEFRLPTGRSYAPKDC